MACPGPVLALRVLDATTGPAQAQVSVAALSLAERAGSVEPELLKSLLMSAARSSLGPEPAFLSARELGEFWIHALRVAFLSRALAEACSYRSPEEAYLAGLLHDFGSLALLATVPNTLRSLVATQANAPWGAIPEHVGRLGTIHAQIGAALLERLQVPFYVSDAVLLHHAPAAELEGTHPLVRILSCAEALMLSRSAAHPVGQTADLLGISASAVSGAEREAAEKVSAVLRGLGRLGLTKSQSINAPPAEVVTPASSARQRLTETLVMRFVREAEQPSSEDTPLEQKSGEQSRSTDDSAQITADEEGWSEALALHGTNVTASSILDQIVSEAMQLGAATLLRSRGDASHTVADLLPLARVVAGVKRAALFLATDGRQSWLGWLIAAEGPVRVELELSLDGQSLMARAARQGVPLASYEEERASQLTGLDLQVARILGADEIVAIPIGGGEATSTGVLIFGASAMKASRFAQVLPFLSELAQLVSRSSAAPARRGRRARRRRCGGGASCNQKAGARGAESAFGAEDLSADREDPRRGRRRPREGARDREPGSGAGIAVARRDRQTRTEDGAARAAGRGEPSDRGSLGPLRTRRCSPTRRSPCRLCWMQAYCLSHAMKRDSSRCC